MTIFYNCVHYYISITSIVIYWLFISIETWWNIF